MYTALDEWRSKTVSTILKVIAILGFFSVGVLFIGALQETWRMPSALFFLVTYLAILGLLLFKGLHWRLRAWGMIFIVYLVGVISLARGGLAGAGREYLIIIPVLATILISIQAGMLSALISLLVMGIFSFLVNAGIFQGVMIYQENPRSLGIWAEELTYTVMLMVVATSMVILFHRYVLRILLEERKASRELEQAHASLEEYSQTLEQKVVERTSELAEAYEIVEQSRSRMKRDLTMAGKIQACFMSQELPDIPGWECSGLFIPARETTGDFYYLAAINSHQYSIMIADVVDKSIGAALLMSFCWGLIHILTSQHPERPDWIAHKLNQGLHRDTHAGQFVTLFYGLLDTRTQTMNYINAGHNPPFVFRQSQGSVQALAHTGVPLGIFPTQTWGTECVTFLPGDCLVMYTDGVTDAENPSQEHFDSSRLIDLVSANLGKSASEIQDRIIHQIDLFRQSQQPNDDMTLLILQREKPA